MRRAFVEALEKTAEQDPRIIFLTGDLGYQMFDDFKEKFGQRYINVGIAEAQMVCAAAGLAMEGFRPFVYSIASFATGRPFEQIRVSIAYPNLPVVIVGAGGGYCYSTSGTTHHSAEDIALMSLLPKMTIVAPGNPEEVKDLVPQLLQLDGPSYIRIGKFGEPGYEAKAPTILGHARLLKDGNDIALVSTGEMTPIVLNAVVELNAAGIDPVIYQFHTIKPLDTDTLNYLSTHVHTIIVIEESTPMGGLCASIRAWQSVSDNSVKIIRVGPPDELALGNVTRESLRRRFRYDSESIQLACRKACGIETEDILYTRESDVIRG